MSEKSIVGLNKFLEVLVINYSQRIKDRMEQGVYIKIREIYTQIRTLLKPSLLDKRLKSNIMSICSCICTHNVIEKCFLNISHMPPLLNVNNL